MTNVLPRPIQRVFLIATAFWIAGWVWKISFFAEFTFRGFNVQIHHSLFPEAMLRAEVAFLFYMAPLLLLPPLLWKLTRIKALLAATVMTLASLGCLLHIDFFNDATFTTSFWAALWLLWLAHNSARRDERLVFEARWLAKTTVALIFLGGSVGKLTAGYWSGEVFHSVYFDQKTYILYQWLRESTSPETRLFLATALARTAILGELFLALAIFLRFRIYAAVGIVTMIIIVAISTPHLFSVMASLIGLLAANLLWSIHPERKAEGADDQHDGEAQRHPSDLLMNHD